MRIARVCKQPPLCSLKCLRFCISGGRSQLRVEIRDQHRGSLVIYAPQRRKCTARPGFHGDTAEAQCGAVITSGGLARAECEQFQRLVSELAGADEFFEVVERQLVRVGEHEALAHIAVNVSVRRDVNDGERLAGKFLRHAHLHEIVIHQRLVLRVELSESFHFPLHGWQRLEILHRIGETADHHARRPQPGRPRLHQIQPRRHRDRVFLHKKFFAVIQCRHRNRPQRAIRHKNQRVYSV